MRRVFTRRNGFATLGAAVAAVALAVAVPMAAEAATSASGSRGCGAAYGYLTTTGGSYVDNQPPGSVLIFHHGTSGTFQDEATYSNGVGKPGGGAWNASVGGTSINAVPSCNAAG